jgi:phosphohistidine phosphatase SixA
MGRFAAALAVFAACSFMTEPSIAEPVKPALIEQLRQGGFVLVMRHASSPAATPGKSVADPENTELERQLDEKGRQTARDMGRAFKALHIPIGQIFSSPTYRARETIRLADFGNPTDVAELGDQGRSMQKLNGSGPAEWLKSAVAKRPDQGRNTLIVTHMPNIAAAFPNLAKGLQDGETLAFKPDGQGHADMIANIPIEAWAESARK